MPGKNGKKAVLVERVEVYHAVTILDRLPQAAMAHLLGVTPRKLRDWPKCPRNPDGPAPAVVRWFQDRLARGIFDWAMEGV